MWSIMGIVISLCPVTSWAQISKPADIAGLAFHVDATDVTGTGVQPANGTAVLQWNDLSGNGYHITGTVATAPFFEGTGFDGLRPGVRFEPADVLSGPDILPTTSGTMTIFFVTHNVNHVQNFSINLNGSNSSNNATTGRYSFHTPWTDGRVYFDSGGCCGTTRLREFFPNAVTETSIYSAQNNLPGNGQLLRVDGNLLDSDTTGHAAGSELGIFVGSSSGRSFDGRFAEIIVYNQVLTTTDIGAVEQYLFCKWKPSLSTETCANITASKSVSVLTSPAGDYALPGSTLRYAITAENAGPLKADDGTVVIIDAIPDDTILSIADIGGAGSGPVLFSDGSPSSGLNYNFISLASTTDDVAFSDNGGVTFNYVPIADGLGLDENVTHIRVSPVGDFLSGDVVNPTDFSIEFDVYLR